FFWFCNLNLLFNVVYICGGVSASFLWYDFVYFIDSLVYLFILIFKTKWLETKAFCKKFVPVVLASSVALFFLNLAFAETD
ncbi:glycerol phosphate lipoteichoic acid synthase, partial [Staphylococcus aureus]|nr:glycerol phosphate lipoteichoic acid synthase [Staphylococcus aureus]